MSEILTSTVRGFYAALGRGDIDGAAAVLAPDVEWVEPDAGLPPLAGAGRFRGRAAVRDEVLRPSVEGRSSWHLRVEEVVAGNDAVIVLGRLERRSPQGPGGPVCRFVHVWTVRGGLPTRVEVSVDTLAAARAGHPPHQPKLAHHPERV